MQHNNDIISGKISSDIENVEWNVGTTTAQLPNIRFGSSSSQTSQNSGDICRICHCESDPQNPLLTPCYCSGSLKYVHQTCLQQWLTASETNSCELCKFPFIMHTKIKPFNEWRSLDMSGVERRRLFCAVLFHFAAALCVIWSLCVLIERAAEEVKRGLIGWPFWTKLVVVTVGLTGGVVFMYIQCRQYLHLCHRWRARNRILLIQNAPEKIHPVSPPSPVLTVRHHNLLPQPNQSVTISSNASNSTSNYNNNNNNNNNNNRSMAQSQCIANIENNPLNYERDWQLDDSNQSSFKPNSQSMTPLTFHDSTHQLRSVHSSSIDDHQIPLSSSHTIAAASNSNGLFKMPSNALFLENKDILNDNNHVNDSDFPKLYNRHSTIINIGNCRNEMKLRRYSDTKLLYGDTNNSNGTFNDSDNDLNTSHMYMNNERNFNNQQTQQKQQIFNVASVLGASIPNTLNETHTGNYPTPQITDIIFENSSSIGGTYDPLDLNIQEMLELDMANNRTAAAAAAAAAAALRKPRNSMNNVTEMNNDKYNSSTYYLSDCQRSNDSNNLNIYVNCSTDNRNLFKSMPNLSASSENLLQK